MATLEEQIGLVSQAYSQALQAILSSENDEEVEQLKARIEDLDVLRKSVKGYRGEEDGLVKAVVAISSKEPERAARLSILLDLYTELEEKYNPYHEPAGTPEGGQFAEAPASRKITYASSAGKPQELPSRFLYALQGRERGLGNYLIEYAIIVNKEGDIIFNSAGENNNVSIDNHVLEAAKDGILTHGHPNADFSFSGADIMVAVQYNLLEIRAVTADAIYRLQRPDRGWPELVVMQGAAITAYKAVDRRASQSRYGSWVSSPTELKSVWIHNAIDEEMSILGVRYSREEL